MGLLNGCGTKPAAPVGETGDEQAAKPVPEQTPVPEQPPVAESPRLRQSPRRVPWMTQRRCRALASVALPHGRAPSSSRRRSHTRFQEARAPSSSSMSSTHIEGGAYLEAPLTFWEQVPGSWQLEAFALDCCGDTLQWPAGQTGYIGLRLAQTQGKRPGDPELRHLFFILPSSRNEQLSELAYAVREAQGPWRISTLSRDELPKDCGQTPPTGPGDRCEGELIAQRLGAILTTGQELRLLLQWRHTRFQLSAQCRRDVCQWESGSYTHDYRLKLAWFEAEQPQTVTLWQTSEPLRAMDAQADEQGRIHVVANTGDDEWRYLLIDSP